MPIRNELSGVFKTIQFNGKTFIVESVEKNKTMDITAKNYIQGTAENRILNVGLAHETFNVKTPILVGGGAAIDGRHLLNTQITNALKRKGAVLPILDSANLSVSDSGGAITLSLKSDANPNNSNTFSILDSKNPPIELDPTQPGINPTREATFYDFRVRFGPFFAFILSSSVDFKVLTSEKTFLGGLTGGGDVIPGTGALNEPARPSSFNSATANPYNWGTQYPWYAVSGVELTGRGQAAVLLSDADGVPDSVTPEGVDQYFTNAVTYLPAPDGRNIAINYIPWPDTQPPGETTDITFQSPGWVDITSQGVFFQVFNATASDVGAWVDLFSDDLGNPLFNFNKSMIKAAKINVSKEMITVDFDFYAYVVSARI